MPIAVHKKTQTAIKDRILKRGKPHKPCPLVHPFEVLVPKPTNSPAKAYPIYEVCEAI